jgi:hypothetical protein
LCYLNVGLVGRLYKGACGTMSVPLMIPDRT